MDTSSSAMDVSLDPVSLRAAALSTLKSKRRKTAPEKTTLVPSRPTPASDLQLDYGQEDTMVVDPPLPRMPSPKSTHNGSLVNKDVQMREEGEISDEEEILPPAVPLGRSPPLPPPPPRKSKSPGPVETLSPEPVKIVKVKSASPQSSLTPEERAPPSLLERFSGYAPSSHESENDIAMSDANGLESTLSSLGPDRVRPGLHLTMDEYDTAKDIILDLLGWGVPPDFLVDCGLTKELVFYVFTELNLRLPDNFDSSGVIPYTPESFSELQQYALMPPPPLPETNKTTADTTNEVSPRVTTPLRPPTIVSSDSRSKTDLHDIERQRRQELLARKAVQASRRLKQSASMETAPSISQSDSSNTDNQDDSVGAVISTEIIEDFLNSIGPIQGTEHPNGVLPPSSDSDDTEIIVPRQPASAGLSSANTDELGISHEAELSSAGPPPTSVDSVASMYSQLSEANLSIDSSSQLSPPREPSGHPRRGIRPVASDFVDFDPTPRGNESKSRLEPPAFSSSIIRRLNLAANFRDIGSRRCVIDLSDSEDDDEQEVKDQLQQAQPVVEGHPWLKRDRRSKASNYHPPASIKSSLSGNQSPAALMMKELEIQRMRELIAKREEETRLKKLASAKSSDTNGSSTAVNHLPSLKQEDVDVLMNSDSVERNGYRNSESATPPPRSVTRSPNEYGLDGDGLGYPQGDLASEAQEAQAVISQQQQQSLHLTAGMVDADPEPSPSTQVNQKTTSAIPRQDANELVLETSTTSNNQQDNAKYREYGSIFELYPLLRGYLSSDLDFSSHLSSHSSSIMYPPTGTSLSSSSSVLTEPSSCFLSASSLPERNLKPLKLAAIAKVLHPFKQICRYEIPGGGTCRDGGCDDVHLSKLQDATVELSDQDVSEYLFNTLPKEWLTQHQVSTASKIVAVLHELRGHSSLEDRVDQALLTLGLHPT